MKRAIISVYDKDGVCEIAKFLNDMGVEIISTGGTYKYLKENSINVTEISEITKFPEILDGRVKTLNPYIHGGILAVRDNINHMNTLNNLKINTIDFVIVNLYPFFEKVKEKISFEEKIEFIDIGGPSMLRSAAKSFKDVVVICDKKDYQIIIDEIKNNGEVSFKTKKKLAAKVFNLVSSYDAAIANFLNDENDFLENLSLSYTKKSNLRYGENSHQKSSFYLDNNFLGAMSDFVQLHGKELSFNNIRDMDVAWKVVSEFDDICCCAVKHSTPCGVAIGDTVLDAYKKAYDADSISIFGGIVAFNAEVDENTAEEINKIFTEIVIAPSFTKNAIEILSKKKNIILIECKTKPKDNLDIVKVDGGILIQDTDKELFKELKIVTEKNEIEKYKNDLIFAMKVVKYVKSNGIVIANNLQTLGISGGVVNRIWATEEAIKRAKNFNRKNLVLASDGFFPFSDIVELSAKNNIKAIIQPGGSINDNLSIEKCNEKNIMMIFTGNRHFKH